MLVLKKSKLLTIATDAKADVESLWKAFSLELIHEVHHRLVQPHFHLA